MTEFEVNGERYRADKLSAFQQFHIARRLSPLLLALGPGNGNPLASFGQALAQMKDEDGEYIITTCLAGVQRFNKESGNWAPVWNAAAKRAMFVDLYDFGALFPIVTKVVENNLTNFLDALPTGLVAGSPLAAPGTP
jgi:hypothetical protein